MQKKPSAKPHILGEGAPITIGISIDAALKFERTGVEEYTFQLVSHFFDIAKKNPRYKFILYSSHPEEKVREVFPDAGEQITIVHSPYKHFWSQRVLPHLLAATPSDIFFSPSSSLPKNFAALGVPGVVTIHGMEWHRFPEHYSFEERLKLRFQTKNALNNARGIVAASQHTKEGIANFWDKEMPPITVIPHGVDFSARISRRRSLPRRGEEETGALAPSKHWRILFIGRKDKRKNVEGMIEALSIVRRFAPDIPFKFSALGPPGNDPFAQKHYETIQNTFVSETEKKNYYKKADIFLFPSHDEGFGMPILEAQAHGIPVVCSSFLKEVAGEGALYCDPSNPQTIASAILTLMLHPAMYDKIKKSARTNARHFSWDRTARETLAFLEMTYGSNNFAF